MIVTENEKRLKPQACPLCNTEQDVMVNGFVLTEKGPKVDRDRGYSFCNCRNVFFTDWSNMKQGCYDEGYNRKYNNESIRQLAERYAKHYLPFQKVHGSGTFVEIGSPNRYVLNVAKQSGFDEVIGVDINPFSEAEIKGNIEDKDVMRRLPWCNAIWASHVFEHFKDPVDVLRHLYKKIYTGGYLFVAMPDPYVVDWTNPYNYMHWNLNEHHILWNMKDFCDVLNGQGFHIVFAKRNYDSGFLCTGDYHILARKLI